MKYVDIHCHLDFKDYDPDREAVFQRMAEQEVGAITIGTDLESSRRAIAITEANENVWACVGVHPADNHMEIFDEKEFKILVESKKVVAIGECGLDYFRSKDEKRQTLLFKQQIEFALKYDKPLMLHCRAAYDEVLDILEGHKKEAGGKLRGNSHFFAGNIEQARRFIELGFTMSFTGVVTFTHDYDEVIKSLPIESIMSETDAPFVAPVPHRGKRNEPIFVVEVVKKLAEIRGEDKEMLRQQILQNAQKMFDLKI